MAAVTGVLTGVFVALFDRLVVDVALEHVLELPLWLIAVLPGAGLVVAMLSRRLIASGTNAGTADEYLLAFHDRRHHAGLAAVRGALRGGNRDAWFGCADGA